MDSETRLLVHESPVPDVHRGEQVRKRDLGMMAQSAQ